MSIISAWFGDQITEPSVGSIQAVLIWETAPLVAPVVTGGNACRVGQSQKQGRGRVLAIRKAVMFHQGFAKALSQLRVERLS
ncbi:hypothetical protein ACK36M_04045 [Aeromonas veronii]